MLIEFFLAHAHYGYSDSADSKVLPSLNKCVTEDYKEFLCYKFRSMRPNPVADLYQVTKGDERVTRVGKFLRKTSIDELPQFFNVLKGDMSVVGPRPHMVSHTHMYAEKIDKFMVRHFVKPGITGLAQISGYRGEVETEEDIINRVRLDIFYLENWSILLDIKICIQSVVIAIRGEEKAYYMDALVSIITPDFNSEKYLSETVNSVLNQTYSHWEMLLVDDYSTDSSGLLEDFAQKDSRIKFSGFLQNSARSGEKLGYSKCKRAVYCFWTLMICGNLKN